MADAHQTDLAHTRTLPGTTVDDAIARVTAALATEGFGVLTRIDVDETLKKKIGVDFRRYVILGACNPQIAHGALSARLEVGLFMPCNVCVFTGDAGETIVQALKPQAMAALVPEPALGPLMANADARLQRALQKL